MAACRDSRMLVLRSQSKGLVRSPHRSRVSRGVLSSSLAASALLLFTGCGETSNGNGSTGTPQSTGTATRAEGGSSAGGASSGGQKADGKGGGKQSSSSRPSSSANQGSGGSDDSDGTGGSKSDQSSGGSGQKSGSSSRSSASTGGNSAKSGSNGTGGGSISSQSGNTTAAAGRTGVGGQSSTGTGTGTGTGAVLPNPCVGKAWQTANPTAAGPFEVAADKNVGPLAGTLPDPIYGDEQQRFSVYRPKNLSDSGYCHPILVWANGYKDNPEQNPPKCIINRSDQWCGQYLPIISHLASHGFVVVAPISTATGAGDPLPTIVGLDWILEQNEDSSSPYYHRLDTANIGQLGHSFGGMSTCMSASEPRYKALGTICGTRALTGVHTPMLFFCGGKDTTVACSGVRDTYLSVKDQPAFFMNELEADHGSWVYGGPNSPSISSAAAWFRVHLMGDTANRKYFYGSNCTFCSDRRVQVEQNSLMAE